jgi:isochorismate pyruvate lyase
VHRFGHHGAPQSLPEQRLIQNKKSKAGSIPPALGTRTFHGESSSWRIAFHGHPDGIAIGIELTEKAVRSSAIMASNVQSTPWLAAMVRPKSADTVPINPARWSLIERITRIVTEVTAIPARVCFASKPPSECRTLAEIRAPIDQIDRGIIQTLGERKRSVMAAAFKTSPSEVAAPERVRALLEERERWAEEEGTET